MNKFFAPALAAGTMLLITGALAAALSATGVIKSVNNTGDALTLMDGKVYTLTEKIEINKFKAGEKVAILYKVQGGKLIATSVTKTK